MRKAIWDYIIVKVRLWQIRADKIIRKRIAEQMKDVVKNIRVEEKLACNHERLKAVVSGNYFYRCTKCGIVTMLTPSFVWEKKGFDEMLEKLQEVRKK